MSTAKFNQWLNPNGTENYKCRAWVNFNGTGTVAIRASGNVSSITDGGTGIYTVNFTTAMSDANYSAVANDNFASNPHTIRAFSYATTSVGIQVFQPGIASYDADTVSVAVFR
jgi:hypothetical protein